MDQIFVQKQTHKLKKRWSDQPRDCELTMQLAEDLKAPSDSPIGKYNKNPRDYSFLDPLHLFPDYDFENDCCNTDYLGITCDSEDRVTSISWPDMELSGTLDMDQLPERLATLDLSTNRISLVVGPSASNSLKSLNLNNNLISGVFPVLSSPLRMLSLANNKITALTVSDPSFLTLASCDISNNFFYATDVPNLVGICKMNGLYTSKLVAKTTSTSVKVLQQQTTAQQKTTTLDAEQITTSMIQKYTTIQPKQTVSHVSTVKPSMTLANNRQIILNSITLENIDYAAFSSESSEFEYKDSYSTSIDYYEPFLATINPAGLDFPQTKVPDSNETDAFTSPPNMFIFYIFGAFAVTLLITIVASKIFKNPKIVSKFARRNSFGSLATQSKSVSNLK